MWTTHQLDELRSHRRGLAGSVAFVPTMGALHAGHASLITHARRLADHVAISIFVNPTQFGANEDLSRYPRTLAADLDICRDHGTDIVFHPTVEQVYPPDAPACEINVPSVAAELEGEVRPTHFAGVCRVVAKLFNMVMPDYACFGMKDYQQFRVIEAMVQDLCMPVQIVPCPTLREADGLAMSSRNVYLTATVRPHAVGLYKALQEARMLVEQAGEVDPAVVAGAMRQVMTTHQIDVDYAEIRHPRTLASLDILAPKLTGGVVALIAGRLGGVRLIDNMVLGA